MSIDDSRPDAAQDSARPRSEDPFLEKLRDLPRMRPDASAGSKPFRPPAPTLSRIGAFTQGCSGLLVVVLALPMLLSAVLYGFYVWGPGMLLTGGILLLAAVLGIWRGARLSLAVSLLVTIGVALLMYEWRYFVFAAAALSPFGQITDLIYNMGLKTSGSSASNSVSPLAVTRIGEAPVSSEAFSSASRTLKLSSAVEVSALL